MNKRFEIKEEHLKLLRNAIVSWEDCEFGAPCIDPKRPYGNSDVLEDMAEILGQELFEDKDGDKHFTSAQAEMLEKLHKELEIVLQIVLRIGKFEIGHYEVPEYSDDWKKIK